MNHDIEGSPLSTLIASVLGGFLFIDVVWIIQVMWLALIVFLFLTEQRIAAVLESSRTGR